MPRRTSPHHYRYDSPVLSAADVNISRVPPETRAAIRAALAARWKAQEPMSAARYAVARQFHLTILTVEAIELAGGGLDRRMRKERERPERKDNAVAPRNPRRPA